MKNKHDIIVTKPISAWNKSLKVNFKDFFKSLTKATLQGASGSVAGASKEGIEAISAVSVREDLGSLAWLLVYRSLVQAVYGLVEENEALLMQDLANPRVVQYKLGTPPDDPNALVAQLDLSLEEKEFAINEAFFEHPEDLIILEDIKKPFGQWLQRFGLAEAQANAITDHLKSYFVFALNNQWRARPEEYAALKTAFDTPFTKASEREQAWSQYSAWLQKQIDEPMFDEAFSLRQVYVPLYAYYEKKVEGRKEAAIESSIADTRGTERVVVDLTKNLEEWLSNSDARDAVRIISGGPGSGKSSFAKMFASQIARQTERRVLFVPLHQFEPSDDLIDAVGNFVRLAQLLPHNPIDPDDGESQLLIIFDGLDELAMQGKVAAEIAQQFASEVTRKVEVLNNRNRSRLRVLISGRDLAVQASANMFRRPQQILHTLPYFISKRESQVYKDPGNLLEHDQRQRWWILYGRANGNNYAGMPSELRRPEFVEITSQPLLNYLVALSFERKVLDLAKESNLNKIYEDLLKAVYVRKWAANPHPATRDVEEGHFIRILEEIAVAAWHGDGRTTTVKEIEEHCERAGLKTLLEALQEGASKGVTRLLMAFYFRQAGSRSSGDKTFEFSHKSFGEYLAARRIVNVVRFLHGEFERQKESFDSGFNEQLALEYWLRLCGPVSIDEYVFEFIRNEMLLQEHDQVTQWQIALCSLITFLLRNGMPMERLISIKSFKEQTRQARNAEEALMALGNVCATTVHTVSNIEWPSLTAFGEWMKRLQGQRYGPENPLALRCLSFLNLRRCILHMSDFYSADFFRSDLQEAQFIFANLATANLSQANMKGASFIQAHLSHADLSGANLENADFTSANLQGSSLVSANLDNADFDGANLRDARLIGASFNRAKFRGANMEGIQASAATLRKLKETERKTDSRGH
ncbi:MAG TPA: pentapeptide repeat-containing protein [Pyrinomonadaceae bacterium]|nr:pentapeptide repeat-containing protein [Pyrinomonadaceae bacterium]